MLFDELVVGEVLIEGANHVVAVAPGFGFFEIEFVAAGFGEANEVEPVAAPALAVVGRGEEAVDHGFVDARGGIGEEGGDLGGGRGQAGEVEGDAPQEGGFVGGGRRGEAVGFQICEEEGVDGRAGPGAVLDGRRGCGADRLEGPKFLRGGEVDCGGGGGLRGRRLARVGRALADPLGEVGALGIGETAGGGHFQLGVGVGDGFDEQARVGIAGDDGCSSGAAALPSGFGIETEAGAGQFLVVAGVALGGQERTDLIFEEFGVVRLKRRGRKLGVETGAQQGAGGYGCRQRSHYSNWSRFYHIGEGEMAAVVCWGLSRVGDLDSQAKACATLTLGSLPRRS